MATKLKNWIHLYVLETPERRGKEGSYVDVTKVFVKGAEEVVTLTIPVGLGFVAKKKDSTKKSVNESVKEAKDKFILMSNIDQRVARGLRATEKTEVFKAAEFHIPNDIVEQYKKPAVVSIGDVMASPKKRRVSLRGKISEISEIEDGGHYKRRKVVLEDELDRKVDVKMWGELAANSDLKEDQEVSFYGVEVDVWRSVTSLNTTIGTTYEVHDEEERDPEVCTVTVIGANDSTFVCADGSVFKQHKDELKRIIGVPQTFKGVFRGGQLVEVIEELPDSENNA